MKKNENGKKKNAQKWKKIERNRKNVTVRKNKKKYE